MMITSQILKHIFFPIFFFSFLSVNSQVVTSVPEFPVPAQSVTLTLNIAECDCNLIGYTGDIYAHTGITVEGQGRWQNVIGDWGNNTNQPKLTKISSNIYQLEISPSINEFYNVTSGDTVTELCLVFRSADATKQTSDIFVNVFDETDVRFNSPDSTKIYEAGNITINAVALFAEEMTLFVDDIEIETQTGSEFNTEFNELTPGKHIVKISATDFSVTKVKETSFFIRDNNNIAELPSADLKDGINYINGNTVTLVLYAPFKNYVYVKGSFNDWQLSLENQMNKTPDGNRYWVTISGLEAGKEYIYQYIVNGEITIADPYCDKISDPWNDHYINQTTYPDLIAYPTDKTTDIASVFQTSQIPFTWIVEDFSRPSKENLIIYELHIRDFIESHDYQTLIDTISYLKNLGINAVELMPINEFEGNSSWGYNPSFYFAPDKYYGTKNKLKEFIDVCHQNGIAVIMDIVLNHSYYQSPLVQLYFNPEAGDWGQPSAENPWYNQVSPNPVYSWGYDFNHASIDTKKFVSRVTKYWLSEYKFDGFRFDFTKGFTNTPGEGWNYDAARIHILKSIADSIWNNTPDAYVILEHFSENSEEKILSDYGLMIWGNINYNYLEAAMAWPADWDFSWVSYQKRGWTKPNLVSYMESHDEERMMFKNISYGNSSGVYNIKEEYTALKRAELAAVFFFTVPGPKMLWQFEELGYDISIDNPCRVCDKPILWNYFSNPYRHNLYSFFKTFIELRKNNEVFSTADYQINFSGSIKTINLNHTSMNVVIIGNFGVTEQIAIPDLSKSEIWYDYYTQKEYNSSTQFNLAPEEYKILTSVKLTKPDVPDTEYYPKAENLQILGDFKIGNTIQGYYEYLDTDGDNEANTRFQWYASDYEDGTNPEPVSGADDSVFTITADEAGKYLIFEVSPYAQSEVRFKGESMNILSENAVTYESVFVYPNPVSDYIRISRTDLYDKIQITDLNGRVVSQINPENTEEIYVGNLKAGIYIFFSERAGKTEVFKFVKL